MNYHHKKSHKRIQLVFVLGYPHLSVICPSPFFSRVEGVRIAGVAPPIHLQETNFIVNFLFKTMASDEFVLCTSNYGVYIDSDSITKRKIWTWFETSIIS